MIRDSINVMRSAWENYQQTFQELAGNAEATETLGKSLERYNASTSKWLRKALDDMIRVLRTLWSRCKP